MCLREKDIQKLIISFLRNNGFSVDIITLGAYSKKGIADIVGCACDGMFIAIEVKRPGRKATKLQQDWLDEKKRHNGIAFIATSIEDVKRNLNKYGYVLE